ncbi:3'-5' exonuclease [Mesonia sp. K7]|uniref:3'-5' exonuclease n=1 Tax=Mesonia sp. K7 TaxID=2218606 RepID=UPI000DA95774|nr:3'-5' exonuclease [Mesonia sp. K7]PZD77430.1 3'-5' exonuclease [Mesonia sp. K7]
MLQKLNIENILFLDIETVPMHRSFDDLSEKEKQLWDHKTRYRRTESETPEDFYPNAGIWAEFGKIVCISVGFFKKVVDKQTFRITSFSGDEVELLNSFKDLIDNYFNGAQHLLCAHNGKEFDFPYIARRMLIHNISLPEKLNLFGKKPWEISHLDTLDLWKFGDYKHYTSLELLTHILDIPSPKTDISGSDVGRVFYEEEDLQRIVTYCENDVVAIAQIILKLRQQNLLKENDIVRI